MASFGSSSGLINSADIFYSFTKNILFKYLYQLTDKKGCQTDKTKKNIIRILSNK